MCVHGLAGSVFHGSAGAEYIVLPEYRQPPAPPRGPGNVARAVARTSGLGSAPHFHHQWRAPAKLAQWRSRRPLRSTSHAQRPEPRRERPEGARLRRAGGGDLRPDERRRPAARRVDRHHRRRERGCAAGPGGAGGAHRRARPQPGAGDRRGAAGDGDRADHPHRGVRRV